MALLEVESARPIAYPHIVATPGTCGGRPRIDGTRISVQVIAENFNYHRSTGYILDCYPHLKAAEVHAALAYYFDHKNEIDDEIEKWSDPEFLESMGVKVVKLEDNAS